ncbi:HSP12 [Candida theae]|uniref:HSP12 n=1 Tax=Candida theae TaxID=1198502 RepID=A0AAD5FX19_9ASCO|nr:HSP12 [Candida theae]KAI5950381.1 HSP12 [Candida theae]
MSDAGRKDFSDKVGESLKPDSQKSTLEKGKETVTDKVDDLAGKAVPDNQKSFGQTVADNVKQGSDDAKAAVNDQQGPTLAETAQEYVDEAKKQISNAAEYVSGVVSGATEGAKTGGESTKK